VYKGVRVHPIANPTPLNFTHIMCLTWGFAEASQSRIFSQGCTCPPCTPQGAPPAVASWIKPNRAPLSQSQSVAVLGPQSRNSSGRGQHCEQGCQEG
jgi:hypothetical protein